MAAPPLVQQLRHQQQSAAIPRQERLALRALAAAREYVAAIRVRAQCFAHQRRQRVHRFAKIDRVCRHHELEVSPQCDYAPPRSADSTVESVVASTPGSTQMRAPLTSISISPRNWPGGETISRGIVFEDATRPGPPAVAKQPSEAIRTGTKPGALAPAAAANLCRHTVSSPRATPLRRATSEMLAPCSKLSATIRAFSCAVHRRRWRCPVITSIRR